MESEVENEEVEAMRQVEEQHVEPMTPIASMRETLKGLFRYVERDKQKADEIGAQFDLEKLREWARICLPLKSELASRNESQRDAERKILAQNRRLEAERYRLFGSEKPHTCYCGRTGFEPDNGKWKTRGGNVVQGPHVRRCRLWPSKTSTFWSEDPKHYEREEGEPICPAAIEFQRERFDEKERRDAGERKGRSPRRYD